MAVRHYVLCRVSSCCSQRRCRGRCGGKLGRPAWPQGLSGIECHRHRITAQPRFHSHQTKGKFLYKGLHDGRDVSLVQSLCPRVGGDLNVAVLEPWSLEAFDGAYYDNVVKQNGLFQSDHALFYNVSFEVEERVLWYNRNDKLFQVDFVNV
ncbi:hypothetical protein ACFX2J_007276 [Malus domestica]